MKRYHLVIGIVLLVIFNGLFYWKGIEHIPDLRIMVIAAIALGYIYNSELNSHKKRTENWGTIRALGKSRFILYEYVLLRGGAVSLILALAISFKVTISLLIICAITPLLGMFFWAGNEVWKSCEHAYTISALKAAGESIRATQN